MYQLSHVIFSRCRIVSAFFFISGGVECMKRGTLDLKGSKLIMAGKSCMAILYWAQRASTQLLSTKLPLDK